ncbi:MAG: hypothetical protein ABIL58_20275 [Pseudomonadota bacterium]
MIPSEAIDYPHPELNRTIEAIGGHYMLTHEHRFSIEGAEVLVFEGYGVVETSCCGTGGCRYAVVSGDLIAYRHARLPGGQWVSRVSPVRGERRRRVVRDWLVRQRQVHQVVFL